MSVSLAYVGVGCNKSPQVMDWGSSNLICFGACNSVAVYDPQIGKIIITLVGHKKYVNCVKWIKGTDMELISGSSDSTIIVWTLERDKDFCKQSNSYLIGHESSILAVDGRSNGHLGTVIVSSASDNTVRVWRRDFDSNDITCKNVINTGSSFALCLNMVMIPNSDVTLLLYGTDTPELVFYSIEANKSNMVLSTKDVGHEDWLRCIDMTVVDNEDILIASSSQDMRIRILRLSKKASSSNDDSFELKKDEFCIGDSNYYLSLESVLYGHEGWVFSVHWLDSLEHTYLLSASFDRTMIVWKPCPDSGVWLEDSRMGELGGDQSLGYYGAKFSPNGCYILAYAFQGSFHLWKKIDTNWVAKSVIGGHCDAVTDISWERNGRYLISVSSDKSTRLHSPLLKGTQFKTSPWFELARPQIHGHALYGVTALKDQGIASCSEEKVVRVFTPSLSVMKLLNYFCDSHFDADILNNGSTLPLSASITALGLSNKANFEDNIEKEQVSEFDVENVISNDLSLNEDFLVQHTLWPEVMKLYGHGNDVFTIASSNDGKILATASKATTSEQAHIILWDTASWNIITRLYGHQLTVTQMAFSPDDSCLLSVSRDRKWYQFRRNRDGIFDYHAHILKSKIMHSRIIWTCAWTHDGLHFATGSRDCQVIIWTRIKPVSQMTSENGSVTALDFGPVPLNNKYLLAIGHESGLIQLYSWFEEFSLLYSFPNELGHHLNVTRLKFRPVLGKPEDNNDSNNLQLASCSDDYSVRVYDIDLNSLIEKLP